MQSSRRAIATIHQATRPTMRKLIAAAAILAAAGCGAGDPDAQGTPPSADGGSTAPGAAPATADTVQSDMTGPNGPRTGG